MARGYTREAYLDLIKNVHEKIPGCAITTDIITGFCAETEEEHEDTVSLMKLVKYEQAFMFAYSEREGTAAARKMSDDVDDDVKQRRLAEIIDAFRSSASERNEREIGRVHLCLVEGVSKKNDRELTGKTDTSKWVVFADDDVGIYDGGDDDAAASSEAKKSPPKPGEYVAVLVTGCSTGTLFGTCLGRTSLVAFDKMHGGAFKEASEETAKASAAAGAR
jgi:tRNA A37 methylthiotransferase MiaB